MRRSFRNQEGVSICNGRIGGSEFSDSVLNSEKEAYGTVPKNLDLAPLPEADDSGILPE